MAEVEKHTTMRFYNVVNRAEHLRTQCDIVTYQRGVIQALCEELDELDKRVTKIEDDLMALRLY